MTAESFLSDQPVWSRHYAVSGDINEATASAAKSPEWKFSMGIHPTEIIHRKALQHSIQQTELSTGQVLISLPAALKRQQGFFFFFFKWIT